MSKIRKASHAGSWYSNDRNELDNQLEDWLSKASPPTHSPARAIIAPHAGYLYCGACSSYAYRQIVPDKIKRIFILGPSHHVRLLGCALTSQEYYQTPLYNLHVDMEVCESLNSTKKFEKMSVDTDHDEHSIEMHLPFIAKVMSSKQEKFKIVPILVGSLSTQKEKEYGHVFAPYLANEENLFVISSDFCHWGQRFRYTHHDTSNSEIWQSIESLDKMGMNYIEKLDSNGFSDYLKKFNNTICGRHPIGILLNTIDVLKEINGHVMSMKFLKYAQSSQCKTFKDSSVSYASASLTIT